MQILIIGGVGALASAALMQALCSQINQSGCVLDEEYPNILLNSGPLPGLSEKGVEKRNGLTIRNHILRILTGDGVERAAIKLVYCVSVQPFIGDLVTINLQDVLQNKITSESLVLCSRSSANRKLFGDVEYADQDRVDFLIRSTLQGRKPRVSEVITSKKQIVLACTDLDLIAEPQHIYCQKEVLCTLDKLTRKHLASGYRTG